MSVGLDVVGVRVAVGWDSADPTAFLGPLLRPRPSVAIEEVGAVVVVPSAVATVGLSFVGAAPSPPLP